MATSSTKSSRLRPVPMSRLEARVPRELKETLERAAVVTGHPTLTSFMIHSLQTSALKAIEDQQRSRLTADESANFIEALLAPAAPNAALRAAVGRYRREAQVGS